MSRHRCITSILDAPRWSRQDAASMLLFRAANQLRWRWFNSCGPHLGSDYLVDIAAANNLLILSREVLCETEHP